MEPLPPAEPPAPADPLQGAASAPGKPALGPGTLGSRWPPLFNLWLFALTFASVLLAGFWLDDGAGLSELARFGRSAAFAGSLLAILLAHEMGHFFAARWHGVDATWPYFIPAPVLSFIGTFGAVIRLREVPRTRAALVDIGASGPLAGFVVAAPVVYVGMRLSHLGAEQQSLTAWTLWDAALRALQTGDWPALRDGVDLGEPLLFQLAERLVFGELGATQTIAIHPVAIAGWFGLFITALNLLPLGQLDGGHVLFAASRRVHALVGPPISALLVGLGVFTPFTGWLLWGVLTGTVLSHHPPLSGSAADSAREAEKPLGWRWLLVVASALVLAASVSLAPISLLLK
jgi:membrane-associated protease RseP (regulator of RpoE activity)